MAGFRSSRGWIEDCGNYTRYMAEQVEILENVFADCPKPTLLQHQEMICNYPILSNLEPNQIKVWFQNRRSREKQKEEANNLQSVNKKLNAANKLLKEENDRLQKLLSHLIHENESLHQQLKNVSSTTTDASCESAVNSPQHSIWATRDPAGLLLVAEEIMEEFLSKATGTVVDWVQIPGMKIVEILKDCPSWFRDCKYLEVLARFPAGNGGTVELIYMQVCEKSISGSGNDASPFAASQFTRAKMLASGYLVRPSDGGGSTIHIFDHLDLKAPCVPEVLRLLYESSKLLAQKMTAAFLPACLFANQAALDMLETILPALQEVTLHQIFDDSGQPLYSIVPKIMQQQGSVILSTRTCLSLRGRHVLYEQAIAWKVVAQGGAPYCLAFSFIN